MRKALSTVGALAGFAAAGFSWGLLEAHLFTLRRVSLPVLPPGGEPVRVLHLSDIHLLPRQRDKLRFIESLGRLKPDLVINTGDNISSPAAVAALHQALSGLRGVPGGFVFGSNDYIAPKFRNPLGYLLRGKSSPDKQQESHYLPTRALRHMLAAQGWVDLNHHRQVVNVAGYRFELRGTDDAHHGYDNYSLVAGPAAKADLSIGVTHAPYLRLLDAMTADGVQLIFAGHTHGGQVCVPGYGALVTNCDIEPARVKGLSQHTHAGRTSWLHISAGLGTSPFATYRFACRPEVTLLTLTPSASRSGAAG